jgi:hypothetical protein
MLKMSNAYIRPFLRDKNNQIVLFFKRNIYFDNQIRFDFSLELNSFFEVTWGRHLLSNPNRNLQKKIYNADRVLLPCQYYFFEPYLSFTLW